MAFIKYLSQDEIPERNRVNDPDNIIQVHGIHSGVMKHHYDMYLTLMRKPGPLSRIQREEIAVIVSTANMCHIEYGNGFLSFLHTHTVARL